MKTDDLKAMPACNHIVGFTEAFGDIALINDFRMELIYLSGVDSLKLQEAWQQAALWPFCPLCGCDVAKALAEEGRDRQTL